MHAIGNDVIDLHHPSILEHSDVFQGGDEQWMQRHVTSAEWQWLTDFPDPQRKGIAFWQMFALKEAASKAITQLGYTVPFGSFTHFETDFDRNVVLHCSGEVLFIQNIETNLHWIHAVVTSSRPSRNFRIIQEVHHFGNSKGQQAASLQITASEYLQERLLKSLKVNGYPNTTFVKKEGIPLIVQGGKSAAPVSFSHSGRFAAFSWLLQRV